MVMLQSNFSSELIVWYVMHFVYKWVKSQELKFYTNTDILYLLVIYPSEVFKIFSS